MLSILNDHGFDDTSTPTKLAFLNDTITDFCSRYPWPFLEASVTLTFDGSSAVPSNLPAEFRSALVIVDPNTGRVIDPFRLDAVEKQGATLLTQTGSEPLVYYFQAGQLMLGPIPPTSTTLRMRYLKFHPDVDSSSTV